MNRATMQKLLNGNWTRLMFIDRDFDIALPPAGPPIFEGQLPARSWKP
jgi:hypothetical protein